MLLSPTALGFGLGSLAAQALLSALLAVLPAGPWREQPAYTAHQAIAFGVMVYVAMIGTWAWFWPDEQLIAASASVLSRLQHPHAIGEHLGNVHLGCVVCMCLCTCTCMCLCKCDRALCSQWRRQP